MAEYTIIELTIEGGPWTLPEAMVLGSKIAGDIEKIKAVNFVNLSDIRSSDDELEG